MNPSFGSVASRYVLTYSNASSNFMLNSLIRNIMTDVADLDMPIAQ